MTNPKKLTALGKMAQFGDTNEVGKYTELSKELPAEEQGEEFVINWQYAGTAEVPNLTLRIEYITGKSPDVHIYEKAYAAVKPGNYELVLRNIGANYTENGEIAHWRISLVGKDKIFAYRESRMWATFQPYIKAMKAKNKPSSSEGKQ